VKRRRTAQNQRAQERHNKRKKRKNRDCDTYSVRNANTLRAVSLLHQLRTFTQVFLISELTWSSSRSLRAPGREIGRDCTICIVATIMTSICKTADMIRSRHHIRSARIGSIYIDRRRRTSRSPKSRLCLTQRIESHARCRTTEGKRDLTTIVATFHFQPTFTFLYTQFKCTHETMSAILQRNCIITWY
jgi:hypothetical protein